MAFNNYQLVNKKWVATDIVFKTDGKLTMREEYYNLGFPKKQNEAWFDLNKLATAKW